MFKLFEITNNKMNYYKVDSETEVVKMSEYYWTFYKPEFIKDIETFDKQLIQFIKLIKDVDTIIRYRHSLFIEIPNISVIEHSKLRKFSRDHIIDFYPLAKITSEGLVVSMILDVKNIFLKKIHF